MFWKVFLHAIVDKSGEGGLKSMGNTILVRKNPSGHRKQLQKNPFNGKMLYAAGPSWPAVNESNLPYQTYLFTQREFYVAFYYYFFFFFFFFFLQNDVIHLYVVFLSM